MLKLQLLVAAPDWLKHAFVYLDIANINSHLAPLSSCLNARLCPSAIGVKAAISRSATPKTQARLKAAIVSENAFLPLL